jgi:hypothetical protein
VDRLRGTSLPSAAGPPRSALPPATDPRPGLVSRPSSLAWSPVAPGPPPASSARAAPPPCALGVTSGSKPAPSTLASRRRSAATTRSSGATAPRTPSMVASRRPPAVATVPDPTPPTGASPAGSGQAPPNVTGYPSAGSLPPPIATTASCSRPPATPSPSRVSSSRSRPFHLDRGYDNQVVRQECAQRGLTDVVIAQKRQQGKAKTKKLLPLGQRWPVERTNSWFTNYGLLRRSTDRRGAHRQAMMALAAAFILTSKLFIWADCWNRSDRAPRPRAQALAIRIQPVPVPHLQPPTGAHRTRHQPSTPVQWLKSPRHWPLPLECHFYRPIRARSKS